MVGVVGLGTMGAVSARRLLEVEGCVTGGLLAALKPGSCIIDHSTIAPETSQKMALAAEQKNVYHLDTPILGRPSACGSMDNAGWW